MAQKFLELQNKIAATTGAQNAVQVNKLQGSVIDQAFPEGFPTGLNFQDLGLPAGFNLTPETGPLLESAFQQAGQFQGSGQQQDRLGAIQRLLSGDSAFQFDPQVQSRFFEQSITQPLLERLAGQGKDIASQFLPGGQTGANARAIGEATRGTFRDIGALQTQFLTEQERLGAELADRGQQRSLSALSPALQEQLKGISVPAQLGGIQRSIGGQQNAETFFRALMADPAFDPRLSLLGALSGNQTLAQVGGTGLGGLGTALQLGGGISSFLGNI